MTYRLHLTIRGHTLPPLTLDTDEPDQLPQAVHRHARGHLGSRAVNVELRDDLTGEIRNHGATVGTFTLTPVEEHPPAPPMPSGPDTIRHGWTLNDLDQLARKVAHSTARWHRATPPDERYDHARHGIIVYLLQAHEPPTGRDLYTAGLDEINRAVHAEYQVTARQKQPDQHGQFGHIHQAARYWHRPAANPVEDAIIDRLALHQVLPTLTPLQREALTALAELEDYERAAAGLSVSRRRFDARLGKARLAFKRLWHEHETPPRRRTVDRRKSTSSGLDRYGRLRITVSQLDEARARHFNGELYREIAPDYGITPQALGRLLRGVNKPAPDPSGGTT